MRNIIQEQLKNLNNLKQQQNNDGSIIFFKKDSNNIENEIKVVFEDYIIKPFEGFDFHKKFNNDIPPHCKTMYGKIIKETEKMYYFNLHTDTDNRTWEGWCPKKSCIIK